MYVWRGMHACTRAETRGRHRLVLRSCPPWCLETGSFIGTWDWPPGLVRCCLPNVYYSWLWLYVLEIELRSENKTFIDWALNPQAPACICSSHRRLKGKLVGTSVAYFYMLYWLIPSWSDCWSAVVCQAQKTQTYTAHPFDLVELGISREVIKMGPLDLKGKKWTQTLSSPHVAYSTDSRKHLDVVRSKVYFCFRFKISLAF